MSADKALMDTLQDELINQLLTRIRDGEKVVLKTGEVVTRACSPQVLTAAIRELERHGVQVDLRKGADLGSLEDAIEEAGTKHTESFPEDLH